jgi:hypothetical protein
MNNTNKSASSSQIMPLSWLGNTPTEGIWKFTGKIVRFEADGFGIIEFDHPIGPSSSSVGIVTNSTTSISPVTSLHVGDRVWGTAVADEKNFASIKVFELFSRST